MTVLNAGRKYVVAGAQSRQTILVLANLYLNIERTGEDLRSESVQATRCSENRQKR